MVCPEFPAWYSRGSRASPHAAIAQVALPGPGQAFLIALGRVQDGATEA